MKKITQKREFSKTLLIQESALIWVMTIALIILAFVCVDLGYLGSLPWITAMAGFPWTAYGVSQACYYNKSKAENIEGGIKYASVVSNLPTIAVDPIYDQLQNTPNIDQSTTDNNEIDIWGAI